MKVNFPYLICLLLSLWVLVQVLNPMVTSAAVDNPLAAETTVSAAIGEAKLVLFGYAPSRSEVRLNGIGVADTTLAQANGYFQFTGVFLPRPTVKNSGKTEYPEICLQATDLSRTTTQPTCIPPLPAGKVLYHVGPVILSPTLTVENGRLFVGDQIKASGTTTPDTEVKVFLARERPGGGVFDIVREAFAYYIPTYQTTSDSQGYFEFNLPADSPDAWRIFTAGKVLGASSPKSNTLNFRVLPWYYVVINLLTGLLAVTRPFWIYIVAVIQVAIVVYLYLRLRKTTV